MTKRMLWYVCLGLLCCGALAMVVTAAAPTAPAPITTKSPATNNVGLTSQPAAPAVVKVDPAKVAADAKLDAYNKAQEVARSTVKERYDNPEAEIARLEAEITNSSATATTVPEDLKVRLGELYAMRSVNQRPGNPLDQGADACPATVIASVPYTDTGTTTGMVNDFTACGTTAPDVIYEYTALAAGTLTASLCGSSYDTKLEVRYGGACPGTTQAGCNDDFCGLQSQLSVAITAGTTYFIVVDGYGTGAGAYTLNVTVPPPCVVECPPGATQEGEGCDGITNPDNFNGGCNSTPPVFSPITCGETVCGTAETVGGFRDTDWYSVTLTSAQIVNWSGQAEFPLQLLTINGVCPATVRKFATAAECVTATCIDTLGAGTWYFWAGPSDFTNRPCGDYVVTLTCTPYTAPTGRCCYNNGANCANNLQVDCAALGGSWTEGLTCEANPCPAERPCASMTPADASLDPVPTTPWAGSINGNCGNFGKWDASFTAVAGQAYHWDLCADTPGAGTTNFDSDIKICDASGNILTGIDGSCLALAWNANDWQWIAPASGLYYVVIAPYFSYTSHTCTGTSANTFTLQYYTAVPAPCVPDFTLTAPGSVSGNTCGALDDCNLRVGEDQIVEVNIPSAGSWVFTLCPGFGWDTYMFLSSTCCGAFLASDDDSWCGLTSEITYSIPAAGNYYIDIEAFSAGTCGQWTLVVSQPAMGRCCYGDPVAPSCTDNAQSECATLGGTWAEGLSCAANPCPPCDVTQPGGSTLEGEPICADEYVDNFNGGCNSTPPVFSPISCGETVFGTSGTFLFGGGSYRDTDWYRLELLQPNTVTWTVTGEFPVLIFVINGGTENCTDYTILGSATANGCQPASLTFAVAPGVYWFWVGPSVFTGVPCGREYVATLTTVTACECEAAADLTVHRGVGLADAVNLRWNATQNQGIYRVFGTIVKNNDGDPNNGSDPDWTLVTEVPAPATPGYVTVTDNTLVPFKSYAVVHDCAPRGRCCYGDPQAPSCQSPVTEEVCTGLAGIWTAGLNCTDNPCPIVPVNDNCEWVTPVPLPATFTGTRDGGTPDCPFFTIGEGNVWIAFTTSTTCDITLDYCGTPGGTGDAWLNLALGCPCTGFTVAASPWGWNCADGNLTATWQAMPAGTYYYPVLCEIAGGAVGPYVINVSCVVPPMGRCCYGTSCAVNTAAECAALSGLWTEGGNCDLPCEATFCVAGASICDEYIASVQLGAINNATGCTGVNNYNDYTAMSATIPVAVPTPYTVLNGPAIYTGDGVDVWVDWNNNMSFSDAGEYFPATTTDDATFTGSVTPPAGSQGTHRMRVRMTYGQPGLPCGIQTYGEVEDYTIVVQ